MVRMLAFFFLSEFWEESGLSLNGNFNDLRTARESSFQSFLSRQNRPLPGDSSDHKDQAVSWETIPCPLGAPLWSGLKWRAEGQILWSKAIARKKGSMTRVPLIMALNTEIQGLGSGLCPHTVLVFFFFLDVKQSLKCDSWFVDILAMITCSLERLSAALHRKSPYFVIKCPM